MLTNSRSRSSRPATRSFRPAMEQLEDRLAMSSSTAVLSQDVSVMSRGDGTHIGDSIMTTTTTVTVTTELYDSIDDQLPAGASLTPPASCGFTDAADDVVNGGRFLTMPSAYDHIILPVATDYYSRDTDYDPADKLLPDGTILVGNKKEYKKEVDARNRDQTLQTGALVANDPFAAVGFVVGGRIGAEIGAAVGGIVQAGGTAAGHRLVTSTHNDPLASETGPSYSSTKTLKTEGENRTTKGNTEPHQPEPQKLLPPSLPETSPQLKQKILVGEPKPDAPRDIRGGHSASILSQQNQQGDFKILASFKNEDGTHSVLFQKRLADGSWSQPKESTVAPADWSNEQIDWATSSIAANEPYNTRTNSKKAGTDDEVTTFHQGKFDGVNWEVLRDKQGVITSSYPTGGQSAKDMTRSGTVIITDDNGQVILTYPKPKNQLNKKQMEQYVNDLGLDFPGTK